MKVTNVSHWYDSPSGRLAVLENLSLHVEDGTIAALVGPSGCGKSTLMRLLAGLAPPIEGKIAFGDEAAPRPPAAALAYMAQNDRLLPFRTALQNAVLPFEVSGDIRQADISDAAALLTRSGLGLFLDHFPDDLSGGMQQRCLLAMHLLTRRRLFLLDEPFAALDFQSAEVMSTIIHDLRKATAATFVIVFQDIQAAAALSDVVHVLSERPARMIRAHRIPPELAALAPGRRKQHPGFNAFVLAILESLGSGHTEASQ